MRARYKRAALAALALGVLLAVAGPPVGRFVLWQRELNPILSGRILAEEQGCFGCHWSFARAEIPNPGSRWGSIPRFAEGNARMYADSRQDIEEFIRFGAPRSWRESEAASARLADQRIRMPAYGALLSEGEIESLVAFASAVERVERPADDLAARGRDLARSSGCFSCHGVDGSGGVANPRSLGGFIPGFLGGNFPDLVQDEAEFREWVREGTSRRLEANPLIRWFWRRQQLAMPPYRGELGDEELAALWTWIESARAGLN